MVRRTGHSSHHCTTLDSLQPATVRRMLNRNSSASSQSTSSVLFAAVGLGPKSMTSNSRLTSWTHRVCGVMSGFGALMTLWLRPRPVMWFGITQAPSSYAASIQNVLGGGHLSRPTSKVA